MIANVRAQKIEEREKRVRKIKERGSANAKAQNLRPKKEHESASVKSSAKERESASAKRKKKRVPSSADSSRRFFTGLSCFFFPKLWRGGSWQRGF
jgi:hypothetical protein